MIKLNGDDMNRIKKSVAMFFASAAIILGATVVAPVATAEPAEAVTLSNCKTYLEFGWRYTKSCYHDYNWWEEFLGYRDGTYRVTSTNA